MKKIVYASFEVDADSYEEANHKLKQSLHTVDGILADTILLDNKEKDIQKIIGSCKLVNHVRM